MESNIMSKIHVWVGYTTKTKIEFSEYFKVDQNAVKKGIGSCPFCKDIGINRYDDDLIGIYKSDSNSDLRITIEELPMSPQEIENIYEECIKKGIKKANTLFYYADYQIDINHQRIYNDLIYIGCFPWY